MAETKTNAMRFLDRSGVKYEHYEYDYSDGDFDGREVAGKLGQDPDTVFKTLVTRGHSGQYRVFVLPVSCTLDLKKAAAAAGEKNVEMLRVADINAVTGYVRGGCSPLGMKKPYPVIIDEACFLFDKIYVSGGRRGLQICLAPDLLLKAANAKTADIIKSGE